MHPAINTTKNSYSSLIRLGETLQPYLLLAIRLLWGYAFFQTGMVKIAKPEQVGFFFESLGIPLPFFMAHVTGWVEYLGGIALMVGFFSRPAAFILAITMLVALLTGSADVLPDLLTDPSKVIAAAPTSYLFVVLTVFAFGPGRFSIDGLIKRLFFM